MNLIDSTTLPLIFFETIKLKLFNYLWLDIFLIFKISNIILTLSIFIFTIICTYILLSNITRIFNNNLKFKKINQRDLTTALENPPAVHEQLKLFQDHAEKLKHSNKQYKTNIIFTTTPQSYIDNEYFLKALPDPGKEIADAIQSIPSHSFHDGIFKRKFSEEITFQLFKKIQDDLEKHSIVSFTASTKLGFFINNRVLPNSNLKADELDQITKDTGIIPENSPLRNTFDLEIEENPAFVQIFVHPNIVVKNIYLDIKHRDKIINLIQNNYYTVLRSTISFRGLKYYFTNFPSTNKITNYKK